jgi:hypothetical protein
VDGGQHYQSDKREYDRVRDEFLKDMDFKVLRFSNLDVLRNVDSVVETIMEKVGNPSQVELGTGSLEKGKKLNPPRSSLVKGGGIVEAPFGKGGWGI